MEDLPTWPASVFEADPTTLEMERTGLAVTNNTKFITTVKKWRTEAEGIKLDIDTATEGVQMDLMSAREFLNVQTLMEPRTKNSSLNAKNTQKPCQRHARKSTTLNLENF